MAYIRKTIYIYLTLDNYNESNPEIEIVAEEVSIENNMLIIKEQTPTNHEDKAYVHSFNLNQLFCYTYEK